MRRFFQILPVFIILFSAELLAGNSKDSYSSTSKLSSGLWFRIAVTSDGIYRIDYSRLKQLGLQNPSEPRIFGNNTGRLSYYNDEPKPDDLKELSIFVNAGTDGIFNEGDYILFYGQGTGRWLYNSGSATYDFLHHEYSDTAFYFLTSGEAGQMKKMEISDEPPGPAVNTSSESDVLYVYEKDDENITKSGRDWFQQISSLHIDPGFKDLITSENIKYSVRVAARAPGVTSFGLYEGLTLRKNIRVQGVNIYDYTGTYFQITDSAGSIPVASGSPSFDLRFLGNGETGVKGWLDRIAFQGRILNVFTGPTMHYRDSRSFAPGQVTGFTIKSSNNDPLIWDITDPLNATQVLYSRTGETITFKSSTDSLRTFIGFNQLNAEIPMINPVPLPNQDLHSSGSADMIIITHPLFLKYAEKLAEIHLSHDNLVSMVVTPQQIYNEFSGGIPDICAIRNFLRMKYTKQLGSANPLKYLLLFGDGSFENKTPPPGNTKFHSYISVAELKCSRRFIYLRRFLWPS